MLAFVLLLADSVIAPGSGQDMCRVLAPADFVRVGVPVTKSNGGGVDDDGNSVYCGYTNGTGKVEVDVFYPAADTPAGVARVEQVTLQNTQGKFAATGKLEGADDAQIGKVSFRGENSALLVIRRGSAVVMISVPDVKNVAAQLIGLGRVVIGRIAPK